MSGWASFAMPGDWESEASPVSGAETLQVDVVWDPGSGVPISYGTQTLRYGHAGFQDASCAGDWDASQPARGRLCVVGTQVPAWFGFADDATDLCTNSQSLVDVAAVGAEPCTAERRLSLWVRPSECGNGILEAGETCDDGDDDNANGCTSACVTIFI